jgi:aminoglycoside phosphotransferase (APT) family kinase protein
LILTMAEAAPTASWTFDPGDRLGDAVRALGLAASSINSLASVTPYTRLPRSYLVTTDTGSQVKIRFGRREAITARAAALSAVLADSRVPAPIARVGRLTAEIWIPGHVLSSLGLAKRHVDAAAELLASVHQFPGLAGERLPRYQLTGPIHRRAERQLSELAGARIVRQRDLPALQAILERGLPARAQWGLVHGDFCAENLVWRADDTLVSIDNETIGRGFIEYDVARTWYRWPMAASQRHRFDHSYRAALRMKAPSGAESRAWRLAAAVKGVHLRFRRGLVAERGLDALREVLEDRPGSELSRQ